jgi:hypothetical protein
MKTISRVLFSSFVFLTISSLAQADVKFWDKHNQSSYAGNGHRQDSYYAKTNPHYGKVDSDGILSPGEIRNPLINYNYRPVDYNKYNNNNYRQPYYDYYRPAPTNGWQNSWSKRPCDLKDQKHYYHGYDSRWSQGSSSSLHLELNYLISMILICQLII